MGEENNSRALNKKSIFILCRWENFMHKEKSHDCGGKFYLRRLKIQIKYGKSGGKRIRETSNSYKTVIRMRMENVEKMTEWGIESRRVCWKICNIFYSTNRAIVQRQRELLQNLKVISMFQSERKFIIWILSLNFYGLEIIQWWWEMIQFMTYA